MKISSKLRNAFAGKSSGTYYQTKGDAVAAFNEVLEAEGVLLDPRVTTQMYGDEGRVTPLLVDARTEEAVEGRLAVLSWYRMPSGRYEVVGYLA